MVGGGRRHGGTGLRTEVELVERLLRQFVVQRFVREQRFLRWRRRRRLVMRWGSASS